LAAIACIPSYDAIYDANSCQVGSGCLQPRSKRIRRIIFCGQKEHVTPFAFIAIDGPESPCGHNRRDAGRDLTLPQTRIACNDRELPARDPARPKPADGLRFDI
jgi:hypothetical protein